MLHFFQFVHSCSVFADAMLWVSDHRCMNTSITKCLFFHHVHNALERWYKWVIHSLNTCMNIYRVAGRMYFNTFRMLTQGAHWSTFLFQPQRWWRSTRSQRYINVCILHMPSLNLNNLGKALKTIWHMMKCLCIYLHSKQKFDNITRVRVHVLFSLLFTMSIWHFDHSFIIYMSKGVGMFNYSYGQPLVDGTSPFCLNQLTENSFNKQHTNSSIRNRRVGWRHVWKNLMVPRSQCTVHKAI